MATYDPQATAAGLDASRRVAWAKYYEKVQDNLALIRLNALLMRLLARFALRVLASEAVRVFDPELAAEANRMLIALRLRSRGRAIVDAAEREQKNK